MQLLLSTNIVLDPIVGFLSAVLGSLNGITHNLGLSLIVLAVLVKVVFWPLSAMQFKSMSRMQALQPRIKALQAKFKGDAQRLQQEQMALYKETGVNPFASCLPLLLQLPILWSVYYAINSRCSDFSNATFAWIGSAMAKATPALGPFTYKCQGTELHFPTHLLATSLLLPDYLLLALYVASMYFSVRFASPAMDPQQAQQQKMMALISPVMIAFIGRSWPSALILYWLAFNVLSIVQQVYLMRAYRPAPSADALSTAALAPSKAGGDGVDGGALATQATANGSPNGSTRRQRRKRGSRR